MSTDNFESRIKGCTLYSFGQSTSEHYIGGCIFVDHMSSYIHMEHQFGISSSETIKAKKSFESHCLDHGIMIDTYLVDNILFKSNAFITHIRNHIQRLRF